MPLLIVAALVWLAIHLVLSGTSLRDTVARRIGDPAFRIVFSVLSVASLVFLVWDWRLAQTAPLWITPNWLRWLLIFAMLPAFVLLIAAFTGPNPTAVGQEEAAKQAQRGIIRVTRHPMLWSFAIWAGVHVIGNGDSAALVFFGTFLITALAGMPSIDGKMARRDPNTWQSLSATTSILPFAAIVQGRNRFVAAELGWLAPVVGLLAWIALLVAHRWLFGVPPVAL